MSTRLSEEPSPRLSERCRSAYESWPGSVGRPSSPEVADRNPGFRRHHERRPSQGEAHPVLAPLPVIILTSSEVPSDIQQASALGVDAFLVKPVSFKNLVDVVVGIAGRWKIPVAPVQKIAAPSERGRGSE